MTEFKIMYTQTDRPKTICPKSWEIDGIESENIRTENVLSPACSTWHVP